MPPQEAPTRPALQRTELGPILHVFSHQVYGRLEAQLADDTIEQIPEVYIKDIIDGYRPPRTVADIGRVTRALGNQAQIVSSEIAWDTTYIPVRDFVKDNHRSLEQGKRLTHYTSFEQVANEGISSGVVMPMQLWRAIDHKERDLGWVVRDARADITTLVSETSTIAVDPEKVADMMTQPHFLEMLSLLAYAKNGALKAVSADINSGSTNKVVGLLYDDIYEFDSDGKVIGFSESFKERWMHDLTSSNGMERRSDHYSSYYRESGGCPVRHSVFKKLGDTASRVLDMLPDEDRALLDRDESAIHRGARLLAFAIRTSAQIIETPKET